MCNYSQGAFNLGVDHGFEFNLLLASSVDVPGDCPDSCGCVFCIVPLTACMLGLGHDFFIQQGVGCQGPFTERLCVL
jgi:hypothetical protein